jgi:serine/threonine protein kinase
VSEKNDSANTPDPADDKTRLARPPKKPAEQATVMAKKSAPKADDATVLAKKSKPAPEEATVFMPAKRPPAAAESTPVAAQPNISAPKNSTNAAATQYTQYRPNTTNNSSGFAKASELAEQALSGSGAGTLLKKRFLLEEALGQGGMGTVYKTRDLRKVEAEDPNPYIATKVLNQDFQNHPDAFVTLQQEAAKSQTLAHPNIVTVHDFDRDGDILFMTMELLHGDPLDKLLKDHRNTGLPVSTALRLAKDLCAALMYAHKRHLIHADFKPGNVFVMRDGSAKVLDFGIARAASKETQRHQFDAGQLGALTPAYATIEMINDEPISFADDVYALACVIYEMLAGRHPYNNVSALDAQQQKLKPKRIEKLTAAQWKALSRGLALEKSQRTPTIEQFHHDLFPRRKPLVLKVAAVLLPVSLIGLGWFAYNHYQAEAQIQNTINEKISLAQSCFAQSDFECAIEQSLVVTNLEPGNRVARDLLNSAQLAHQKQEDATRVARLLKEAESCFNQQDFACAQIKTRELLKLDQTHAAAQTLLNNASESMELSRIAQRTDSCLENGDLECVQALVNEAVSINASHQTTLLLQNQLLAAQTGAQEEQNAINQALNKARQCLNQKQYDCAINHADSVTANHPGNLQAQEIKQAATLAKQSEERVQSILAQAKTCLDKQKNYSCAIAKAEAALDLVPGHAEAAAIKRRAQDTQQKLKTTGFTIQ